MALVTLQRSPSPSNDPDEDSAEGTEEGSDGKSSTHRKRSKSTLERLRKIFSTVRFISKLRPCLSESYFTVKGAALILPHSDVNRKTSRKNHGGEIQRHLQSMLYLLRPEDTIKVAIRLESQHETEHRYMALVSTMGRQDTEECVLLGMDCCTTSTPTHHSHATPPSSPSSSTLSVPGGAMAESGSGSPGEGGRGVGGSATIGMVLPIWMGMKIRLNGDGGFAIVLDDKSYLFNPVSVQAMWTAVHTMNRALQQAEATKYLLDGLTHTWVEYYRSKVDRSNQTRLTAWHLMEDVEIFAPATLNFSNENEQEKMKLTISAKLKEVMMTVDLDEATCRSLRLQVEEALHMKLHEYLNYFDEELIRILGQMDSPSLILDQFLYLGSEWNASNLEELQKLGIKYILNVTREIDNFFTGMFFYCNVRVYDVESSELMSHWFKTYKFIDKARKNNSKVLVHCKMGISRSASTVMAYLMKKNQWSLDKAFAYVKERRSCVRPNKGFMDQLQTYEGILNASNRGKIFHSKSEHNILEAVEEAEGAQQGAFLGDSLFRVMSGSECSAHNLSPEEEILLRKNAEHNYTGMEPDFETDSRSADSMEESLPDNPSPMSEQPPTSLQLQVPTVARGAADRRDESPRPGSSQTLTLLDPQGNTSRIKSDTSWIKLELPGESTTDPPEAMEVKEGEDPEADTGGRDSGQGQLSDSGIMFVASPEAMEKTASQAVEKIASPPQQHVGKEEEDATDRGRGLEQKESGVPDLGVHHYYNREQIPWNPGKVRNLREEFMVGQNGFGGAVPIDEAAAKSADANPAAPTLTCGQEELAAVAWEKSVVDEGAGQAAVCVPGGSQSAASMAEEAEGAVGGGEAVDEESMETDEQARSVYEREDIHMTPGTVRRTRQQIEERQKGSKSASDYGKKTKQGAMPRESDFPFGSPQTFRTRLYGSREDLDTSMISVKRSSSLREEREINRDRDSERRKTCTPIVSSPPEKASEMEGAEETVDLEAAVLQLGHQIGESSTDDVEMEEVRGRQGADGDGGGDEKAPVNVYTYGEETVPVKAGIVRRQKQEIENKSWEAGGGHQRSLSLGSTEEAANSMGPWYPDHHPNTRLGVSLEDMAEPATLESGGQWGQTHNIPASAWTFSSPALPQGLRAKQCRVSPMDTSGTEAGAAGDSKTSEASRTQQQQLVPTGVRKKPGKDCSTGDSRASASQTFQKQRHYSDPAEEEHCADAAVSPRNEAAFRPYAHSFSSSRKPVEKCYYDAQFLAMIREIGSAFVSSPQRREEEEGESERSLVKHLVKNIEKETKVPKPERKIVIVNSDASQGKRLAKTESGSSSLFAPSPEFLTNIERQLSQSSPQPPVSPAHSVDCLGQQPPVEPRDMPESSGDSCAGISLGSSVTATCPRDGDGSEQAPSVVKHLRGRFEGGVHHCDSSEGEVAALHSASAAHHCVADDEGLGSVVMRNNKPSGGSCFSGFSLPGSLVEGVGDTAESLSYIGHLQMASSGGTPSTESSSRQSRRPCSAEHVGIGHSSPIVPKCGSTTPRVQAPWNREVAPDMPDQEVSEGVKVRKLHGKSYPLSRPQQQQQQQGDASHLPSIQRHRSSHSTI